MNALENLSCSWKCIFMSVSVKSRQIEEWAIYRHFKSLARNWLTYYIFVFFMKFLSVFLMVAQIKDNKNMSRGSIKLIFCWNCIYVGTIMNFKPFQLKMKKKIRSKYNVIIPVVWSLFKWNLWRITYAIRIRNHKIFKRLWARNIEDFLLSGQITCMGECKLWADAIIQGVLKNTAQK